VKANEVGVVRRFGGLVFALAVLVFTRVRGSVAPWVALHRWLAEQGVPSWLRNLDAPLLMFAVAVLAAAWTAPSPLRGLGLRVPPQRAFAGVLFGLAVSVPMLVGCALGGALAVPTDLPALGSAARGVLVAPVVEETFFRGLFVAVAVRTCGVGFWPEAVVSSFLFGSIHVPWNASLGAQHLGAFVLTGVGGLWYAWLLRAHDWNLWVPVALHAGMNGAWALFAVGGGAAGGGLWPNVGRAATVVVGTVVTIRRGRRQRSATT
jgi:uncharacterized protein